MVKRIYRDYEYIVIEVSKDTYNKITEYIIDPIHPSKKYMMYNTQTKNYIESIIGEDINYPCSYIRIENRALTDE